MSFNEVPTRIGLQSSKVAFGFELAYQSGKHTRIFGGLRADICDGVDGVGGKAMKLMEQYTKEGISGSRIGSEPNDHLSI